MNQGAESLKINPMTNINFPHNSVILSTTDFDILVTKGRIFWQGTQQ